MQNTYSVQNPTIASALVTDGGNYNVTFTDPFGCTASTTVAAVVNPMPVGSATPQTICSGATSSVALNSTIVGTTFTYTATLLSGTVAGFNGCTSSCGASIAQTLTNPSNTADGVVRYTVTPTSPLGCVGATFTLDVTVNPKPAGSTSNSTICSGTATNIALTSS